MPDNPHGEDQYDEYDDEDVEESGSGGGATSFGLSLLAVLLVIGGIVAGGFLGFMINFGACWKEECNAFEEGAMFYVPLISLLFTLPLAYAITRKRD